MVYWQKLYVIEGSQFSAATLGKEVEAELKLNNQCGASYLAKASVYKKGCQLSHLIDSLELCEQQQATLIEGAEQALQRFKFYQAQLYWWMWKRRLPPIKMAAINYSGYWWWV